MIGSTFFGGTTSRSSADAQERVSLSKLAAFASWIIALSLVGCSSGTPIEEGTYVGGMQTQSAVVEPYGTDGYRTISGDPLIAVNGGIEQESMLPYGGGDEGIRQAEDESVPAMTNMGN